VVEHGDADRREDCTAPDAILSAILEEMIRIMAEPPKLI